MASEPADGAKPVLEDEDVPVDEPEIAAELLCWFGWEPLSPWTFGWVLAPESPLTSAWNVLVSKPLTSG